MKCPSCGAEIGTSKFCQYCGTQVSIEMQKEQEQLNKVGCPKCGSTNIQFKRENQGEIRGKNSKQVVHRTVGFCKDCGATWYPNSAANDFPRQRKTWLWVLGWIFIFPVPLTILMLRNKKMKPALKYGIIAVAWIAYFMIALGSNSTKTENNDAGQPTEQSSVGAETEEKDAEQPVNHSIYADAKIVDLMNGFGTEKIGTISVVRAQQSACTEDALADWFFNYVQAHSDCNYHIIAYTDNPTKGVYTLGKDFIQKDVSLTEETDGSFSVGDSAGSTNYSVDIDNHTITMLWKMVDAETINRIRTEVEAVIPNDYKNSKCYAVDISGIEGELLDCNLTLVNNSFADADYQSIAIELAKSIKNLDLGIGYFNITFQSDDYTINAISSIDDLSTQNADEMTTKPY